MSKKEAILQSSLNLIVDNGLHSVTMADIADKANVGIGTIYRNFKDKEDIVQQLWIYQKEEESHFIFNNYKEEGTIKERFWFLWGRVIEYFSTHRAEYYFSYHFAASPILTPEIHQVAMKDFEAFDKMFQEGIEQGMFKNKLSSWQLRLYTFGSINGWLLWTFDLKIPLDDVRKEVFLQMAWDSILI